MTILQTDYFLINENNLLNFDAIIKYLQKIMLLIF